MLHIRTRGRSFRFNWNWMRFVFLPNKIKLPYLFTYKAHSVIRRTLNFRRRLWQVSKIKISPKYPVIRRNQNYGKIFSNYAKHSSSFLWSKLQVEDRSRSRSREQQPWNCSRIRNIPGECRFLYTRRPGWTKKVIASFKFDWFDWVRLIELTEKFQFDYVRLPNQPNSNPTDWVRLICGSVSFDWLRRVWLVPSRL